MFLVKEEKKRVKIPEEKSLNNINVEFHLSKERCVRVQRIDFQHLDMDEHMCDKQGGLQ